MRPSWAVGAEANYPDCRLGLTIKDRLNERLVLVNPPPPRAAALFLLRSIRRPALPPPPARAPPDRGRRASPRRRHRRVGAGGSRAPAPAGTAPSTGRSGAARFA